MNVYNKINERAFGVLTVVIQKKYIVGGSVVNDGNEGAANREPLFQGLMAQCDFLWREWCR